MVSYWATSSAITGTYCVLILVVVEDGLVRLMLLAKLVELLGVLILVVVEDGLVHYERL